jgi:hypothetical protein
MLLSGRQAAQILHAAGISVRQARRILDLRLAGEPVMMPGAHLYQAALVEDLAARPVLTRSEVASWFPSGLFVARRDVPALAGRDEQLAVVQPRWPLPTWVNATLGVRLWATGPMPFVATVTGFVVLGAELVALHREDAEHVSLELAPPGAWFASLRESRIALGPGGRSWWIV